MRTWLLLTGREKWLKKGLKLLSAVNPQASHNPKFLLVKCGIHGDSLSRSWGFRHIGRAETADMALLVREPPPSHEEPVGKLHKPGSCSDKWASTHCTGVIRGYWLQGK